VAFLHGQLTFRSFHLRHVCKKGRINAPRELQIAFRINQLLLLMPPIGWLILLASPFIGSFLGLLADRIPQSQSVISGRSHCDHCAHALAARDLIPFASWLWLRGRCRYCKEKIGLFAPTMELAALVITIWAASETSGWIFAASCLFGWWLLVLAAIDWRTFLLPDVLTLPLTVMGIAISYAVDPAGLTDHLIGALAGFLVFAALGFVYARLRGREGLGFGDAKLMAALGAWLSWQGLPTVLLLAAMAGLLFVLMRSVLHRRLAPGEPIPFGTFLAFAGWLVWLYGPLMPQ
jgi:leader peptidase (prepilin peptidase) / N-methyltransferase